jgi:MFS family permease
MSQAVGVERSRAGWALPQLAGMVGNVLEWYDFAAYGFLAATFAANFFPLENHLLSLVASYAVFAVAFVTRPLGGLLFGHIGDRIGRRMALLISVLAMAGPSFAIGLLPNYAGIGVLAPILLILLRMIRALDRWRTYGLHRLSRRTQHRPPPRHQRQPELRRCRGRHADRVAADFHPG